MLFISYSSLLFCFILFFNWPVFGYLETLSQVERIFQGEFYEEFFY